MRNSCSFPLNFTVTTFSFSFLKTSTYEELVRFASLNEAVSITISPSTLIASSSAAM